MIKIAHFGDTHIKLLKQQKEYREVFEKMYERLRNESPDLIVHCGDLFHNKTNLSPEAIQLGMDFLKSLADIAPLYLIAGNHDTNLSNVKRLDAITPIVQALDHKNIHYLREAQEVFIGPDLCLNAFSMLDEDNWKPISDKSKINIALYHGSLSGVMTDAGYVLEHGDHPIEIFEGFDFALLGDIHKTHQILDLEGRVAYPGSTIQQNHGETNDKGFLIWNIESKDKFSCKHHSFPNPTPFITVELEADGQLPEECCVPKNAKLRLVSNTHVSLQALKKAVDIAKTRFSPESITVHNRPGRRISVSEISNTIEEDNLRDITIQESLMKEYLKEYKLKPEIEEKIFGLNKQYNTLAEQTEEVARNVHWKLRSVEWSNLFNYGENNKIDFTNVNGILGIFGKNYTGKSSVIDSILWTIFNSISKNIRKNVDIINQNKSKCFGKVKIEVDNKIYTIQRESEKYVKKLYGEETLEAKTTLDFSCYDKTTDTTSNLNGLSRTETDANIRKVFGTIEDFLLTSMTSQTGSLSFINEGSTKRKEIFGKFLDLEMFEKKFKLGKDDSALLKGAIKRLEGKKFDEEIKQALLSIEATEKKIENNKSRNHIIKTDIDKILEKISKIEYSVAAGPKAEFIDIVATEDSLRKNKESLKLAISKDEQLNLQISNKQTSYVNIGKLLSEYDYDELKENQEKAKKFDLECRQLGLDITILNKDIENKKQRIKILDTVPCGDSFPSCRFLIDAIANKNSIGDDQKKLEEKEKLSEETHDKFLEANSTEQLKKYEELLKQKQVLEKEIIEHTLRKEQNSSIVSSLNNIINDLELKIKTYFDNEAWMVQLKTILKDKSELKEQLDFAKKDLEDNENTSRILYNENGSAIQKKTSLENEQKELGELRDQYLAYDLFCKCMHSNGIVYDIIKKKLPVINQEISKILSTIVNFDVFFEDDGKKLDIYIKHPKYEARSLETGSGAENSIAAIAIRIALIKVSSLPVSDIIILDEPATSLDEENMEGFTRILEMIKGQFKTVIMISHLDALKDTVDDQIIIENVDGYAKINM